MKKNIFVWLMSSWVDFFKYLITMLRNPIRINDIKKGTDEHKAVELFFLLNR